MKTKHLLLMAVMLLSTVLTTVAQNVTNKHLSIKNNIPFGKKLPPPDLTIHQDKFIPQVTEKGMQTTSIQQLNIVPANTKKKTPEYFRQLLLEKRKTQTSLHQNAPIDTKNENNSAVNNSDYNFHLLKDINALSESNPYNYNNNYLDIAYNFHNDSLSFALLDNVIYFVADDGIHGSELWRSDGTDAGTFLLKDIDSGATSSYIYNIISINGKIYFSAYYSQLWVSDGTEAGTQPLNPNVFDPGSFFSINKNTYFIADGLGYRSAIWQTDGTTAGTTQVIDIGGRTSGGEQISQPTLVNGVLFFTFIDYETVGWQIWRSDLTDAGTYHVGPFYPVLDSTFSYFLNYTPAQLTNYNSKLYFSANDGTGRKLWVSDGTDAGTKLAPGNHNVLIDADFLGTNFPIVNNILCVPGEKAPAGNGLYIYDASNTAGLVKIKDFAPVGDTAFIVPMEMQLVNNTLYFKVTNYTGGVHDELWSSKGTKASTQLVYKLFPGETLNNLYNASGSLYFVKDGKFFGSELWRTFETFFGTFPVLQSDVFRGRPGSHPEHLTAFKGRIIFSAADEQNGNELYITNNFGFGAALVKDINTVNTSTALAGYNPYNYLGYAGVIALENDVLFTAYERAHGKELYKSDGTAAGTELLNDVIPGDAGFDALLFISKNDAVYFIAVSNSGYSIYKTKGTKNSLRKITSDYTAMITFAVADNGLVFYEVYNYNTGAYELWRSDGTTAGTYLLSSTLYYAYFSYLNAVGNTAFFVAGDATHGYELWKSDGSVNGTTMVKDINAGLGNSLPSGMFVYNNEVYFAAYDGFKNTFWKSNGTKSGTIKLKNIDPWYGSTVSSTERYYFEVSNDILYFAAIDTSNAKGSQLWKTDGTSAGTQVVKDINLTATSFFPYPRYFTNVNGTIFFIGDDGVNGAELWKTNGTKEGTQLVKDITPGSTSTFFLRLASFDGKLFFTALVNGIQGLWSSDGTADGTNQITDPGISGVNIAEIYPASEHLFFPGYTSNYGLELYAGKADESGKFVAAKVANDDAVKISLSFNAVVYPNPATSNATLQITGNTKNVFVSITDINSKKIWQGNIGNTNYIKLPIEKYASGAYIITVTNGKESKTIKLIKP